MRPKLDVDALLSHLLTWLLLVSYMALVYVIVVAMSTYPFSDPPVNVSPAWWLNVIAIVVVALTFMPVHRWVRTSVRELIYSHQAHPYPPLTQLNRQFDSTASPHAILPTIAETFAHALKLPYVEIEAQPLETNRTGRTLVATFGRPPKGTALERVPLMFHDRAVGELRVTARRGGEPLSQPDLILLHDLARHVGISLYAAQLTEDLQHARQQLVIAREEERRRIRNDLHDGLAPTLSALQLQLGALRNLMRRDPDQAETMINDLREDLRTATAEIRQLVYDLRPPMLDELGLVRALRSYRFPDAEFCFEVNAPEPMPALSAAMEVAVYRIATEAVHNVVKHSQATECVVCIKVASNLLTLSVTDNGNSPPGDFKGGVGLHSMRERAAELGGTLAIQTIESGGTCVLGQFPLAA